MNNYEQEAIHFLKTTGVNITVSHKYFGIYGNLGNDMRDVYEITLSKGDKIHVFTFGQSIAHSGKFKVDTSMAKFSSSLENHLFALTKRKTVNERPWPENDIEACKKWIRREDKKGIFLGADFTKVVKMIIPNPDQKEPTAYDVLACLQKYDVGTLADFLEEFEYVDGNTRQGIEIYPKVVAEYNMVKDLWTEEEIEQLQEIQ